MHNGSFIEAGRTEDVIKKIMPGRQITLRLVTNAAPAVKLLETQPGVSQISAAGANVTFFFDGDDGALAELNAALVRENVGVALFEERKTTLHELYLAIAESTDNALPA